MGVHIGMMQSCPELNGFYLDYVARDGCPYRPDAMQCNENGCFSCDTSLGGKGMIDELTKAIEAWEEERWWRGEEYAKTVTPEQKDLLRRYRQARWYIRYLQDVLRERTYESDKFYCEWPGKPFAYHPRTEEAVRSFLQAWKEEKARCWRAFRESLTPEVASPPIRLRILKGGRIA